MTAQQLYNIGKEYEKEIDKPMMVWNSQDINGFVKFKENYAKNIRV